MRKLFILTIILLAGISSFAQRSAGIHVHAINVIDPANNKFSKVNPAMKTSAIGDTLPMKNIADTATLTSYSLDSNRGFVTGTNYYGAQAFAERYDFYARDTTVQVIGVYALFAGTVNPASTKTITFNIWDQGVPDVVTDTLVYSGFPNNVLNSLTVPITQIGIGTISDTTKAYIFATPTPTLINSFFAGYSISYNFSSLNGDTIGLACSKNSDRTSRKYTDSFSVSSGDTIITIIRNVQNATMASDYNWYDNYYQVDSLSNDLAIYPIVVIYNGTVENVKGITRNNLTFFGNYPNPAANSTNIKFSLLANADVTLQIMDMSGRIINTLKESNLSTGEHIIPVNTSDLAAGDYLYLIHTSAGDGIAAKMTILK
jgi:hypothetical protein